MSYSRLYPGTKRQKIADYADKTSHSGLFCQESDWSLQLKIDIDKPRPSTKPLDIISGSITVKKPSKSLWSGKATAAFFRSAHGGIKRSNDNLSADVYVVLTDGGKRKGHVDIKLKGSSCDVTISIESRSASFANVQRKSLFFKTVDLDIDYVEKVILPEINVDGTKMNIYTAFGAAGIELLYNSKNSQQVTDPTPDTAWSKADMYAVMDNYFQSAKETAESIWCLTAGKPPDRRYQGFSFANEGKHGFGLFAKHKTFIGMDSCDEDVKYRATRRFLHILVHECGHCLGLSHPFEQGNVKSLSWMNYAWKYDGSEGSGKFYENFQYTFENKELFILRHQPNKIFKLKYAHESGKTFQFASKPKSYDPNVDSDEEEEEEEDEYTSSHKKLTEQRLRKVSFSIKFRQKPFKKGDIVEFEGTLRNIGKLECKIEPDLSYGGGNLTLYITDPEGNIEIVEPFVHGIEAPTRSYMVLGKSGSREYPDVYQDIVSIGQSNNGAVFKQAGTYQVKAVYQSEKIKAATEPVSVTIVHDASADDKTDEQVRVSASLDGYVSDSRSKVIEQWDKLVGQTTERKDAQLGTIVMLMKGLSKQGMKVFKEKSSRSRQSAVKLERAPASKSAKQLIDATTDLVMFWNEKINGDSGYERTGIQLYSRLVLLRAALLSEIGESQAAEVEVNQMIANLVWIEENFGYIKRLNQEWKNIQTSKKKSTPAYSTPNYQEKFEKLLFWTPTDVPKGEKEDSGLGLGMPFNSFDDQKITLSQKYKSYLEKKEEDTDDFEAVLEYAEGVLHSQEVNHQVYQSALETYVVHSKLAKKHNIRYPEPQKLDASMTATAALAEPIKRVGKPEEVWMNYWRCDADFNYHHRHWHAVYGGNFSDPVDYRQGELFGYMHSQMLARYDAERESWGIPAVKPYQYNEVEPDGFNAGWEFHNDPSLDYFRPRPEKQTWNKRLQRDLEYYEGKLYQSFKTGSIPNPYSEKKKVEINYNIVGHIVESSNSLWSRWFGSLHNQGHMAFCQTAFFEGRNDTTYMGSSLTAVRDPIFFRWHKRVDNIIQDWHNTVKQEVGGEDDPGVVIEPSDVLILPGYQPPSGFGEWNAKSGNWKSTDRKSGEIQTYLYPREFKFELDNKLGHEPFSYHIRVKRKPGKKGDLRLTLRLFICQEKHKDNRRRWIEMDKFVIKMASDQNYSIINRPDKYSSVIKRQHIEETKLIHDDSVTMTDGNCQCGWPLSMLLPRGVYGGEKWVVGLFISDNTFDKLNVETKCGSMSYCGTYDQIYPDARPMGYPFAAPLEMNGNMVDISTAAEKLSNFCISPFVINNDYSLTSLPTQPTEELSLWRPYSLVEDGIGEYKKSRITNARFRVCLDDKDFRAMGVQRIRVHFEGRTDNPYRISKVKIALRKLNSLNVDSDCNEWVKFNGADEADVPPLGLVSDELVLPTAPAPDNDYFVTFTLKSTPGCFLRPLKAPHHNTYYVRANDPSELPDDDNWDRKNINRKVRGSKFMYCVKCLSATISK